jgi:hypothetical protein
MNNLTFKVVFQLYNKLTSRMKIIFFAIITIITSLNVNVQGNLFLTQN